MKGYVLDDPGAPQREAPEELQHLMIWYGDIRNRQHRGQRYEPISLEAIRAYEHFLSKLGIEMTAFDWEMMFRLDDVWTDSLPKDPSVPHSPPYRARPKATRH